jgi:hypothetical protein
VRPATQRLLTRLIGPIINYGNQQLGSPQLTQPETDMFRRGLFPVLKITLLHQPANHRPILVTLRFLGVHEVFETQQFNGLAFSLKSARWQRKWTA